VADIIRKLNEILVVYCHYYGITDNMRSLENFENVVSKRLFYCLNRRSQRRSYTWEKYNVMIKTNPLAVPRIYVSVYE